LRDFGVIFLMGIFLMGFSDRNFMMVGFIQELVLGTSVE